MGTAVKLKDVLGSSNILPKKAAQNAPMNEKGLAFIKKILPCGLSAHSLFYKTGSNKYVTVLIAYSYPSYISDLLFADIFNRKDVTVTLDITHKPKDETVADVEKSLNELASRGVVNRNTSEDMNDSYEMRDLQQLHADLQRTSESIAYTTLRFIVSADSEKELSEKVEKLQKDLRVYGIQTMIPENEMLSEYRGMQNSADTVRQPMPVKGTLERQFFFYYQSHSDPNGTIWGETPTGGLAVINPFLIDGDRKSFDIVIIGKKGSGKSASICSMTQEQLAFGNKVLSMDVEGSLSRFAEKIGGKVITPSNEAGRINVLELRSMFSAKFEDDKGKPKDEKSIIAANFTEEISRVMCFFYQMLPEMDDTMANLLNDILRITYRNKGITGQTRLDGMNAEDFPVMTDLLATIRDELYVDDDGNKRTFRASLSDLKKNILERLEIAVKPLAEGSYAQIFNGISSVDVSKNDFVVFDVSLLAEMESKVFNAALLNIMALMWGEVYNNRALNEGRAYEDYRFCICEWDEAQRFINTNNPKGLEFMDKLVRRDRKYSAGLWFASQTPRDFAPSGASEQLDKIKNIFSLVQYKILMQQDSSDYDAIEKLFPDFTRSEIESTSYFSKGDSLISLGSGKKIRCNRYIPEDDLKYFGGGK